MHRGGRVDRGQPITLTNEEKRRIIRTCIV
jgi:hypothetical protein